MTAKETTSTNTANIPNTNGTNGNSSSLNMTDHLSECDCNPEAYPFTCPRHHKRMTAHLHQLCQTRADYRQLWLAQADPSGAKFILPPPARPVKSIPRVPLRQWLTEHLDQPPDSAATKPRRRTLRAALEILEGHCYDCADFDRPGEHCRRCRGCGGGREANFRHSLRSILGHCPLRFW